MSASLDETEAAANATRLLRHAIEQIDKRQYWNAQFAVMDALRDISRSFNEILKGRST